MSRNIYITLRKKENTNQILIIGINWPPETFILRKLKGLVENNFHVTAASTSKYKKLKLDKDGFNYVHLPSSKDSVIGRGLLFMYSFTNFLIKNQKGWQKFKSLRSACKGTGLRARFNGLLKSLILLRENPDIVHFEWNSAAIGHQHLLQIWGCPSVISCRGSQINIRPHLPGSEDFVAGLHKSFENATAVHCVSAAIKSEAEGYGLAPEKAMIIRPAVDPGYFFPAADKRTSGNVLNILSVGNLHWVKGYEYALLAIRKVIEMGTSVQYQIIGDGEAYQNLLFTIHDLGLQKEVCLLGKLSPEQVREKMQSADIFLLSSLSEGISNAVLEAMSCGLPVVTTDCGGMREAVSDGVEGFVVPVRDSNAMADSILKLAEDQALRDRMGFSARARVLKDFDLANQSKAFADLYRSILGV